MVAGGQRLGGELAQGYRVAPTVFADVSNTMTIAREEIFGPVASVIPFDMIEEALALANATEYGLGGGVWINCYGLLDAAVGFGGFKHSGYGCRGGPSQIEDMLYQKAVYLSGR